MKHKMPNTTKPLDSLIFKEVTGLDLFTEDNDLFIEGDCTKAEAEAALAAHNPPAPVEPTLDQKLASVGLSLVDLKAALGL
jgi:hypothetical protein